MIYHGDCLEIMDQLIADGVKVDAIITDPPYLIKYKTNYRKNKNHEFCSEIEGDREFDYNTWAKYIDVLLHDNTPIYVFGSWKTEPYFRGIFKAVWKHKNNIVWVKNNWTAGDLKAQYGQRYEIIMYYNKGRVFFKNRRPNDVVFYDRVSGKKQKHQNEKPVELIEEILLNSTNEGDIILDSFMGSGTTGVACNNLNRQFIGIEKEKKYFDIAKERIEK